MLNHIDQTLTLWLNGSHSLYVDGIAWASTQTITWIPTMLVLIYVIVRNNSLSGMATVILSIGLCILLADQVASTICKPLVARFRPTNDPFITYSVDVVNAYRGGKYGFFSSHAANTTAVATFLSLLFRHRPLIWWLYSWALLNCWTRVYLGVHYVGDLLTGIFWGLCVGYGIYKLCESYSEPLAQRRDQFGHRTGFTSSGYNIATLRLLAGVLLLSYLAIAFYALFTNLIR